MSYHNYLKIEKEKMLIDMGNNVDKNVFLENLKNYSKFKEILWSFDEKFYLDEKIKGKKISELTLNTVNKLILIYEAIKELSWINSNIFALDLANRHMENGEIETVGEDKLSKYKGWKIIK